MPGAVCAVSSCKNGAIRTRNRIPIVSYHTFPKNEKLRNVWVKFCQRGDDWDPNSSHICSEHFEPEGFLTYLEHKLMDSKARRRLHPTAYPKITTSLVPVKSEDLMRVGTFKEEESLEIMYSNLMQKHKKLLEEYSKMQALNKSFKLKIKKLIQEAIPCEK